MPDPTWQALYRAALVEPNPIKLNGRIDAAQRSIRQRLEQIEDSGDARERQQLNDALAALFTPGGKKAICLSSVFSVTRPRGRVTHMAAKRELTYCGLRFGLLSPSLLRDDSQGRYWYSLRPNVTR